MAMGAPRICRCIQANLTWSFMAFHFTDFYNANLPAHIREDCEAGYRRHSRLPFLQRRLYNLDILCRMFWRRFRSVFGQCRNFWESILSAAHHAAGKYCIYPHKIWNPVRSIYRSVYFRGPLPGLSTTTGLGAFAHPGLPHANRGYWLRLRHHHIFPHH